jgi:hypothetical protein
MGIGWNGGAPRVQGSRHPRTYACLDLAFPVRPARRRPEFGFSKLNTLPTSASVYASPAASRQPAQNSRSGWFAIPFL